MKVVIGKYRSWFGPYQLAQIFTKNENTEDRLVSFFYKIGLAQLLAWIDRKKKRKIKIRIDDYDVWSMDSTLAYIILPMLKKVKETKHGTPSTDEEDAPHITYPDDISEENKIWNEDRWNYILDEMIWAFEQVNSDWEDQYRHDLGEYHLENKDDEYSTVVWDREAKIDLEGMKKHGERMKKGFTLFGKYYQHLWT